ncbi:21239_t:CDS:2, partial [Gigaspora rosea]
MSSELPTIIKRAIEGVFNENPNWTLLEFLNYRAEASDFTYDKASEHKLYREALKILSKDHDKARKRLLKFELAEHISTGEGVFPRALLNSYIVTAITQPDGDNEKSSVVVKVFWLEVEKRIYEKQISIVRADGILNILKATNKSQQLVMNIQHQYLSGLYSNVQ